MGDFEVSEIMVVLNHQIKMVFELDVFVTQKMILSANQTQPSSNISTSTQGWKWKNERQLGWSYG